MRQNCIVQSYLASAIREITILIEIIFLNEYSIRFFFIYMLQLFIKFRYFYIEIYLSFLICGRAFFDSAACVFPFPPFS